MPFDQTHVPDYAGLLRLDGQVWVVLGAGPGIGRQSAHAPAQSGPTGGCVRRGKEATENAPQEVGPRGIRVNTVSPGLIKTPRWQTKSPEWFAKVSEAYPLRRIGEPSEIGSVILFLASEMARNMTGQIIVSDGGLSIQSPLPVSAEMVGWTKDT